MTSPKPPTFPSGFTKAINVSSPSDFRPPTKIAKAAQDPYPPNMKEPKMLPYANHAVGMSVPPVVVKAAQIPKRKK